MMVGLGYFAFCLLYAEALRWDEYGVKEFCEAIYAYDEIIHFFNIP